MSDRRDCDEVRSVAAAFVLGALEAEEMDAVRAHLADCPEAHAEFLELGSVVPALAVSVDQVAPPAALKGRILAAAASDAREATIAAEASAVGSEPGAGEPPRMVAADPSALRPVAADPSSPRPVTDPAASTADPRSAADAPRRPVAPTTGIPPAHVTPAPFPTVEERTRRADRRAATSSLGWALRAAAVVAIVALAGWNLLLQGRLDATETYNRDVAAVLEAAAQPGAMTAILAPQAPGGPRGIAALTPDGSLRLAVRDLGPTSGTQVYETWAIAGGDAPVPLGGFTVGASGTASFEGSGVPAEAGLTVALTLEPAAGATAPTSAPVAAGAMTQPPGGEAYRNPPVTAATADRVVAVDAGAMVRP